MISDGTGDMLQTLTALIVDDDPLVHSRFATLLGRYLHKIHTAVNGKDALNLFRKHRIDIVLSDVNMPVLGGIELAEIIRKESPETPIILMTGQEDTSMLIRAINIGIERFLVKPLDIDLVVSAITTLFHQRNQERELHDLRKRLQDVAASMQEGMLVFGEDLKLQYANPYAEEALGYAPGIMKGLDLRSIADNPEDITKLLSLFNKTGHISLPATILLMSNYAHLDVSFTASSMLEQGVVSGIVILFQNITERKHAEEMQMVQKFQEVELMRYRERYHSVQQDIAFRKMLHIMHDELSNTIRGDFRFEALYRPLDAFSGDTYGSALLPDGSYFVYIIDAMGQGMSASVASVQAMSYLNEQIRVAKETGTFEMQHVITSFLRFMRNQLLDDEMMGAVFLHLMPDGETAYYANFGMPPMLVSMSDDSRYVDPSNPPIVPGCDSVVIDTLYFTDLEKILLLSDGLLEHIEDPDGTLFDDILTAFRNTPSRKDLLVALSDGTRKHTDDVVLFFISRVPSGDPVQKTFTMRTGLDAMEDMVVNLTNYFEELGINQRSVTDLSFALNELLLNAIEHGNFGITWDMKQRLLANDQYDQELMRRSENPEYGDLPIVVQVRYYEEQSLIEITITDSGAGFDVSTVMKKIRVNTISGATRYHGRGIIMAQSMIDGVWYNERGTSVTLLKNVATEGLEE